MFGWADGPSLAAASVYANIIACSLAKVKGEDAKHYVSISKVLQQQVLCIAVLQWVMFSHLSFFYWMNCIVQGMSQLQPMPPILVLQTVIQPRQIHVTQDMLNRQYQIRRTTFSWECAQYFN